MTMDLPFKTKLYAFAAAALIFAWPLLRMILAG